MRNLITCMLLILCPGLAFSDEDSGASKTSAAWRMERPWSIGIEYGLFVSPVSGFGVRAAYALSPNFQVGFSSTSGTYDAKTLIDPVSLTTIETFDVAASLNEIEFKWFSGNSFYLGAGIGQRKISFDLSARDTFSNATLNTTLDTDAIVVNVCLGNIWTLDSGLYLGGEWLAVAASVSSSFETSAQSDSIASEDLQELLDDSEDIAKRLGEASTGGLALFLIGYQF